MPLGGRLLDEGGGAGQQHPGRFVGGVGVDHLLEPAGGAGEVAGDEGLVGRSPQGCCLSPRLLLGGGQDVEDEVLPLCEDHEVPCITVDHGWSAGRIQQAIERRHAVADAGADSRDDDGYDEE